MKLKQNKAIENVGKTVFAGDDGFYLFRDKTVLEKYSFIFNSVWSLPSIDSQYLILENSSVIIVYSAYEKFYIINKENGTINKHEQIPFFPKNLIENCILGVLQNDDKKAICKYDLATGKLTALLNLFKSDYCSVTNENYAVIGEKISYRKIKVVSLSSGLTLWEHEMERMDGSIRAMFYSDNVIIRIDNGYSAFVAKTGEMVWRLNYNISAFDETKGLIYVLSHDYLVISALTGEEVVRVNNWRGKQITQYPALEHIEPICNLSEEYLVFSSRTREEKINGGVFFIDKNTAEVKEYFRIVFDKDPFQRKDWYGNLIPDDQQIPFMPLETPIYKDGRLYVVLPSAIEGQRDLYIYEREE